ncbi:MAG TPA: DUF4398 domain-containing protein [Polyangiaceae bacterium]|nr:DUF4398 domain-containing protein [Polyangiaceae bacterium]
MRVVQAAFYREWPVQREARPSTVSETTRRAAGQSASAVTHIADRSDGKPRASRNIDGSTRDRTDASPIAALSGSTRSAHPALWFWRLAWLGLSVSPLLGCGHGLYALSINQAAAKLEEARELDAEHLAPYEFYMAKEHLAKARSEAAEAEYGDALDLSDAAAEYAEKASRLARDAHRGAGR